MDAPSDFPSRLVWWRRKRGLSQLQFAMAVPCSQRHISFLELGRTKPSRDMVLRISAALDLPLRQSNELLLAAGFAPVWAEEEFGAPSLASVREALDYILAQQEPFPAVVVDRRWNLLLANKGALAMVEFLVGPIAPGTAVNLADALVAPEVRVFAPRERILYYAGARTVRVPLRFAYAPALAYLRRYGADFVVTSDSMTDRWFPDFRRSVRPGDLRLEAAFPERPGSGARYRIYRILYPAGKPADVPPLPRSMQSWDD